MKANLFINFYCDKDKKRQNELSICVLSNIYNKQIDRVVILVSNNDLVELLRLIEKVDSYFKDKIIIKPFEARPTFNNYFKFTEEYPKDINIIANKDIIIDSESLIKLKSWHWGNYCLALSRWDFVDSMLDAKKAVHYNLPDSQDTWILKGSFKQLKDANFGLGIAGCDNKIALLLEEYYTVINPSIDIKTYHLHLSNVRNYTNIVGHAIERIPPPYRLIQATIITLY